MVRPTRELGPRPILSLGLGSTLAGEGAALTVEDGVTTVADVDTITFAGAIVTDNTGGDITVTVGDIALGTPPGASVYHNTTQTVNVNVIPFNSELWDTDGFHSTSSNTDRLTVPAGLGGKYLAWYSAGSSSAAAAAGEYCRIYKNGTTNVSGNIPTGSGGYGMAGTVVLELAAGDFISVFFTGNRTLGHVSAYEAQSQFGLVRLGGSADTIDWGETADITTQDYDDAPDGGVLDEVARADHLHGMPSASSGTSIENPCLDIVTYSSAFTSATTSCAVTTPAYAASTPLLAFVYSSGRGANSITQTNVTWTQRYSGSGNSQFFQVWSGVVAGGSAGTTATGAFTGNNTQFIEIVDLDGWGPITSASLIASTTNSAQTVLQILIYQGLTAGHDYVWAITANAPASSTQRSSYPHTTLSYTGGQGRGGLFRSPSKGFSVYSTSSGSSSHFGVIVELS